MYNYPYLQNFQPQPTFNQVQQNTPQDKRIWVQNEASAEAYLLAPNGFARLWDNSANRFYEKRADATGRPLPMDIYEYKCITPQKEPVMNETDKLPFDEINEKIEAINERIDKLEQVKKGVAKNAKQSNADDTSV